MQVARYLFCLFFNLVIVLAVALVMHGFLLRNIGFRFLILFFAFQIAILTLAFLCLAARSTLKRRNEWCGMKYLTYLNAGVFICFLCASLVQNLIVDLDALIK